MSVEGGNLARVARETDDALGAHGRLGRAERLAHLAEHLSPLGLALRLFFEERCLVLFVAPRAAAEDLRPNHSIRMEMKV